jgi:hypothetical protein
MVKPIYQWSPRDPAKSLKAGKGGNGGKPGAVLEYGGSEDPGRKRSQDGALGAADPKYNEAIALARECGYASVSLFCLNFGLDNGRSVRLVLAMAEDGYLGLPDADGRWPFY